MKRFRLSTLMLLVVIAALGVGMIAQEMRHRRREAEYRARIAAILQKEELESTYMLMEVMELRAKVDGLGRLSGGVEGASGGK